MLTRWAVALLILIPAVAGCRSALPDRSDSESCYQEDASSLPGFSEPQPLTPLAEPITDDGVTLASLEQPESVPAASDGEGNENQELTLTDLERIAFSNNPTLSAAAARIEKAQGKQLQAGLYPNPVAGYHATEIGNRDTAGQQGAFISQRFVTGGKLRLDQAIAGMEIEEANFHLLAQEQRVLSDLRVRFYEALVSQRRVELTEELARIGDDLVIATEKLLEGQLGTQNDLLQAQISADESYILLDNAQNENTEARRRLAAVTGIPTMPMTTLVGELDSDAPSFDWDSCQAMVLGANPELDAARTRVERASIAIRRAKREPVPDVDLSVSVRHHNVTTDEVANVQVGIPIPIFNRNQGNILKAEAEWVAALNEAERLELDLQDRLAVVYRRYANARAQVDRYRDRMVPKAKQSLDLVTDGYGKGQVEYLTLLTAQQTYLRVNLSYLASWQELRTSSSVLEGQLLTGSLSGPR